MREFEAEVGRKSEPPIREIQPVPVPGQYFLWGPIVSGFVSIFPGLLAFGIGNMIFPEPQGRVSPTPGLIGFGITFVLMMFWMHRAAFQGPSRTRFAIYRNRIESESGVSTRSRRSVFFDKIIDVRMSQGIFQRPVGAGSITLVLQQSNSSEAMVNAPFLLSNIPDPSETYDLICALARESRREG